MIFSRKIFRWCGLLICSFGLVLILPTACRKNIGSAILVQAGDISGELESGGMKRLFLLHPPTSQNKKLPLIIALHGGGGQGKGIVKLTGLNDLADRNGFFVVYPDGVDRNWNDGRLTIRRKDVDDVKFISDLIAYLVGKYSIDPQRVYVTGISNGGMMSYRLACELSDKVAAIAVVAASMPAIMPRNCNPSRAVPVIMFSGTDDPLMPFNGGEIGKVGGQGLGGKVNSVKETVDFWVKRNRTKLRPEITTLPDVDPKDGTTVSKKIYGAGQQKSEVVLYTINGGGHTWPGGTQYLPEKLIGKVTKDINGSELIQVFLLRYAK